MTASLLRVKLWAAHLIAWASAALLIAVQGTLMWLATGAFYICAAAIPLLRCEECGVLAYRKDSRHHGMPKIDYLLAGKHCPNCGVERI